MVASLFYQENIKLEKASTITCQGRVFSLVGKGFRDKYLPLDSINFHEKMSKILKI